MITEKQNPTTKIFFSCDFICSSKLKSKVLKSNEEFQSSEELMLKIIKTGNTSTKRDLYCPIVRCSAQLNSLEDFEGHYHARHTASCSKCSRVFPTSRLLSIHVSEAHDSYFWAKVARGFLMYDYKSRQQHLVDKLKFPMSFEYNKKAQPSKKHRQKKHLKKNQPDKNNSLVSAVSRLSTSDHSPSSVSFGRHRNQVFTFVLRAVQQDRKHNRSAKGSEG
ncbi:hypothetical protein MKX01_038396 [Papaver californicum]|nr:hypothetical protein MKX01_038396 [Papaver californicum]